MGQVIDRILEAGADFEILSFTVGRTRTDLSAARLRLSAPTAALLDEVTAELIDRGATLAEAEETDARLARVEKDGVAPDEFYSTTIYPTEVRVGGAWIAVDEQRMDAVIALDREARTAQCRLIRALRSGEAVVVGVEGIRTFPPQHAEDARDAGFGFMSSSVSSERRVELAVEELASTLLRLRERGGKAVVVAGPVVVHTGGAPHLAALIRHGFVQALLGGNAIAVHDIELALYGTSLGVHLEHGRPVREGHKHHLRAINLVRGHGSIRAAVQAGAVPGGILAECIRHEVPFALAGSIRDDGPLPDTIMDLLQAQAAYQELLRGADLVLMLASMLHAIGVGNMTPSGVQLVCVDINPAVVTKLADRGSLESVGIVTDVGLFLRLLAGRLGVT